MSTRTLGQHLRASNDAAIRQTQAPGPAGNISPRAPWAPSAQDLVDVQEFFDVVLASWVAGIQDGKTTRELAIQVGRVSEDDASHERMYQLLPTRYFSETLLLHEFKVKPHFRGIWHQFLAALAEHDLRAKWSCNSTRSKDYAWATLRVSPR